MLANPETLLAEWLAAYAHCPARATHILAAAAAITALADHGWGQVTLEWENGQLRVVRTTPVFKFRNNT